MDFLNASRDLAVLAAECGPLPLPPPLPALAPDQGRALYAQQLPGKPETDLEKSWEKSWKKTFVFKKYVDNYVFFCFCFCAPYHFFCEDQ